MTREQLIALITERALELGRVPTPEECIDVRIPCRDIFGSYQALLRATNLKFEPPPEPEPKLIRKYNSLCSRREQIQGFFRHTLDLKELFDRAGNPPSLKCVAQPDTHVKYMNRPTYSCFLKFCAWYKPDVHLIMGDFADCEGISHWGTNDLKPQRLIPEMKLARAVLKKTVDATPTATTRLYLEGNHEYWIQLAIRQMPQLFEGLEDFDMEITLEKLLDLDKFGYVLFPMNELIQIGHAHFTHGIYTGNAHAKKHLETFKCNIYYGHLHDTQEYNATSIYGNLEASSLGCLCRLDALFLKGKPNNWVNSFGVYEFFPDGTYTFLKPKIFNDRMSFCGEVFIGDKDI